MANDVIMTPTSCVPKSLKQLIEYVKTEKIDMINVLRKFRFWPALQIKNFFSNPNLLLLHNTYKRTDVSHFQELYDECRSVVIDLNAPDDNNIVVTYAQSIPVRYTDSQYEAITNENDTFELNYEGTVVTVYYYENQWYFGTSSCPSVNSSRFFHPTKSHGQMFNEALAKMLSIDYEDTKDFEIIIRKKLTDFLSPEKAYAFLLIHHENKHIMNYTSKFGENYSLIMHLNTRDRITLEEVPNDTIIHNDNHIIKFESAKEALEYLRTPENNAYAIIATTANGKKLKISLDSIVEKEENDLGNPNVWHNMLWVYIKNRPNYKITDYQNEYIKDLEIPKTSRGRELAPTYLIHTVICTMRDILFKSYELTTTFNIETKRYTVNKDADSIYPSILRFHLTQLRNIQYIKHNKSLIDDKVVYQYICRNNSLKNLRLLIKYFSDTCDPSKLSGKGIPYGLPTHIAECFKILDTLLSK